MSIRDYQNNLTTLARRLRPFLLQQVASATGINPDCVYFTSVEGSLDAAVTAAENCGGGIVYVDRDETLSAAVTVSVSDIHIIGVGMPTLSANSSLNTDADSPETAMIYFTGADRCSVSNLILDGTSSTSSTGIKFFNCDYCFVDNVVAQDMVSTSTQSGYGVWIFGPCTHIVVRNSRALNNGYSGFDAASDFGFSDTGRPTATVFEGCYANGNAKDGFDIYETLYTRVVNCTAISNLRSGIFHNSDNTARPNFGTVISGNVVIDNGDTSAHGGIELVNNSGDYAAIGCQITGNFIYSNENDGILINRCNFISITGNVVANNSERTDVTFDNISIKASDDIHLTGNMIYNIQSGNGPDRGIKFDANCIRCSSWNDHHYDSGQSGNVTDSSADGYMFGPNIAESGRIDLRGSGQTAFQIDANDAETLVILEGRDLGNDIAGPGVFIGANTNATNPNAGTLRLAAAGGTTYYLWVDATGDLRIGTSPPAGATSDTSGTVVGTQT